MRSSQSILLIDETMETNELFESSSKCDETNEKKTNEKYEVKTTNQTTSSKNEYKGEMEQVKGSVETGKTVQQKRVAAAARKRRNKKKNKNLRRAEEKDTMLVLDSVIAENKMKHEKQESLLECEETWRKHLSMSEVQRREDGQDVNESWMLKRVAGETLLGEDGEELHRKLGLSDGEKREVMVDSIKAPMPVELKQQVMTAFDKSTMERMIEEQACDGWHPVNLGRSYVSGNTVYNLFAAVSARRKGLGTHIGIGSSPCYLFDGYGRRYYMTEVGKQLRFKGRLYAANGEYQEIELVHDTGAAANIIKETAAELWADPGDSVVCMGGYT